MRGEAGYNMVVLIVAITVLNILVAAMLPLWSTQIRREKEEELIFRGFQYAEAIRVFHARFQRYPNRLEELLEVKPRCIRQLWKDPISKDGKWWPMPPEGQQGPLQPLPNGQPQKGEQSTEQEDENGRGPQFGPKKGETVYAGPIAGVRSKSHEKSILILFGQNHYDEWTFTEDRLSGRQASPGQAPGNLQLMPTRWIGRPGRFLNQPEPQIGTPPDGRPSKDTGNRRRRSQ